MKEILIWILPNNGYETVLTFKEHLRGYLREHPGISVFAKVRTPASLWEDLFRIIKNPHHRPRPDIVQLPAHWTSTLAHLGLLQDLKELDSRLDLRKWFPPVQDNCRFEGSGGIYSLPWWMELRALYYSVGALQKAKIDPASLAQWKGFRSACERLAAGGYPRPVANPNPHESVIMADLAPSIWSAGGDFFSKDGSRSLFQRDDATQAIAAYFELLDKGWMPLKGQSGPTPKNLIEGGCVFELSGRFPTAAAPRRRAEAALPRVIARSSGIGGLPKGIGVGPYPAAGRGSSAMLTCANLAILREVEGPRETYALFRELVREAPAAGYARAIGALPATETELAICLEEVPEFKDVFRHAIGAIKTFPNLKVLGTLEKVFNRTLERLVGDVLARDYAPEVLRRELIHAAAEIDYVLSLYG